MKAEEFKQEVLEILETEIEFDKHVDLVINHTTAERQNSIIEWVKRCSTREEKPEFSKAYKDVMGFIYKSNDNKIRGILTREKNAYFIALFLGNHKYYERKRRELGL